MAYAITQLVTVTSNVKRLRFIVLCLPYDYEGNVGDEIECQNKYLKQTKEGIDCYVKRFSGDREPSAVYSVNPITSEGTDQERENQQCPVNNRAPHKESSDGIDIHSVSPFFNVCLCSFYAFAPQHFLYFFPLPQGHGSFLPTFGWSNLICLTFCSPCGAWAAAR